MAAAPILGRKDVYGSPDAADMRAYVLVVIIIRTTTAPAAKASPDQLI
jgi:hypothetical protein